jgi:hypothetical protein
MTLAHVLPGVRLDVLPSVRFHALPDMATKAIYFSLATTVFVFVSILLTGIHP